MSESRRDQIVAGVGISPKKRRAYIDRWLAEGSLESDPDLRSSVAAAISSAIKSVKKIPRFLVASVRHVGDGMSEATQEDQEIRWAICRQCPSFDAPDAECGVCGCNLKIKTRWRTSECPQGKWKAT